MKERSGKQKEHDKLDEKTCTGLAKGLKVWERQHISFSNLSFTSSSCAYFSELDRPIIILNA